MLQSLWQFVSQNVTAAALYTAFIWFVGFISKEAYSYWKERWTERRKEAREERRAIAARLEPDIHFIWHQLNSYFSLGRQISDEQYNEVSTRIFRTKTVIDELSGYENLDRAVFIFGFIASFVLLHYHFLETHPLPMLDSQGKVAEAQYGLYQNYLDVVKELDRLKR